MFENIFGGKKNAAEEAEPVLPSKAELEARAAKNGGGRTEFSTGEDLTETKKQQEAFEKNGWNEPMNTTRDETMFRRENEENANGAPIDYIPVDEDERKSA
jgi:hypothetical protein